MLRKRKFGGGEWVSKKPRVAGPGIRALQARVARPMYRARAVGERKFVDLANAVYACNTTGSITLIPIIAQGASESQRIGRHVTLKSIQCHGVWNVDSTATLASARYLLVYDKQPNAALPAITAILNTANYFSFLNDANKDRFIVLRDKKWVGIGNSVTPTSGKEAAPINFFLKLNHKMTFGTGGTGLIADINTGGLYLITVGDIASGTADANISAGFRVRYVDP